LKNEKILTARSKFVRIYVVGFLAMGKYFFELKIITHIKNFLNQTIQIADKFDQKSMALMFDFLLNIRRNLGC